ncbi:P-loop ATPase, Sll1717 family [Chitinolyticbacter meiyuanensis]|uniref:P-loop ATPase, Sll1717 family n=1 Tax=Chitinolyticbacter meiyuanensis TaxID=682798 RepID=UPI00165253D2|nr:P-loop NTPase fold protein [Chitinolyticbacter meiyuanensis]
MNYIFRKNSSIGANDAESDNKFLLECFVDTGDLDVIRDCQNPKRLIVGRTGAGKSALLSKLRQIEDHVVDLEPESLALNYICNSDVIGFFEALGVNLEVFYQLLWKHVFVVELLREKFKIDNDQAESLRGYLSSIFNKDKKKEKGLAYLKQWGEDFWNETEYRIKEFTTKLESDLRASVDLDIGSIKMNAEGGRGLSEELKAEVIHRGQRVVNAVQVRDLIEVMNLLAEDIFSDPQKKYFIIIDRLDEGWVDDRIRYKVVRALIETVKAFQRISSVKVVVAMREDLLMRVFDKTRDAGFQAEKYEALFLRLRWSKDQLKEVVDRRINYLVRQQYTARDVKFEDVFQNKIHGQEAFDYLVDRTLLRPRDIIAFVNCCLELCEGKASVPSSMVKEAEFSYSKGRLSSLCHEWYADYKNLEAYSQILSGKNSSFDFESVLEEDLNSLVGGSWSELGEDDPVYVALQDWIDGKLRYDGLIEVVFRILYRVSLIGVKPSSYEKIYWSFQFMEGMNGGQYKSSSAIVVHPMFWRALGVVPSARPT